MTVSDVKLDRLIDYVKAHISVANDSGQVFLMPIPIETVKAIIAALERLKAIDEAPDPLGDALNSGDGVYRP